MPCADQIRYDPYRFSREPEHYVASYVADVDRAFCIPKAILLCACARAVGIPSRLGFADVINHLHSDKLRRAAGKPTFFVYHGFTELHLGNRWFKLTPAFNIELCERFNVRPLDFDGTDDALFHEFEPGGKRHMQYVRDRGRHTDLPF